MLTVFKNTRPIGYLALIELFQLKVIPHFRYSYVTPKGSRQIIKDNHYEQHIYPRSYAPRDENNPFLQLEFAIKYDGINLEILKKIFAKLSAQEVANYAQSKPTGRHARKIWFLYEYLMDKKLAIPDIKSGQYFDLLDSKKYYTSQPLKSRRHRINNNLLGNRTFCPIVRKTAILNHFEATNLAKIARDLIAQYDPLIVDRATHYLYTKETMSSYKIEREYPTKKRMARFIELLQQVENLQVINKELLNKEFLIELQINIVDPRFANADYRNDQNYIGEQLGQYRQKIHYISPQPQYVAGLMAGLLACLSSMLVSKVHPVIIAATISFGLVFIHPFDDGNGRLHRFLIHYILSYCGFTPQNTIFPVSATMLNNLQDYDRILEHFSVPLMSLLTDYTLDAEGRLTAHKSSLAYYQYIDYTEIVEYLFDCIQTTINTEFKNELSYIANYDKTKKAIQNIIDMPDKEIDRIIKFITQNNGKLSSTKRQRYFSKLIDAEIDAIQKVVQKNMSN